MGHPEAITFPVRFPGLRRSLVVMTMARSNIVAMRVLSALIGAGLLSTERAAAWVEWLEGVGQPAKTPDDYLREITQDGVPRLPPLFAIAKGRRDGRNASVAAAVLSAPAVGMGGATGVPLALGLALVRPEGEARRGVFAAEMMVDPDEFFERLAPLCTPQKRGRDDLLLVSRSWEERDLRAELAGLVSGPNGPSDGGATSSQRP
jgi:saccharopine dehydrogenase-like NADP-dependent oxidoreductase